VVNEHTQRRPSMRVHTCAPHHTLDSTRGWAQQGRRPASDTPVTGRVESLESNRCAQAGATNLDAYRESQLYATTPISCASDGRSTSSCSGPAHACASASARSQADLCGPWSAWTRLVWYRDRIGSGFWFGVWSAVRSGPVRSSVTCGGGDRSSCHDVCSAGQCSVGGGISDEHGMEYASG
jgi:hypothetical protein